MSDPETTARLGRAIEAHRAMAARRDIREVTNGGNHVARQGLEGSIGGVRYITVHSCLGDCAPEIVECYESAALDA